MTTRRTFRCLSHLFLGRRSDQLCGRRRGLLLPPFLPFPSFSRPEYRKCLCRAATNFLGFREKIWKLFCFFRLFLISRSARVIKTREVKWTVHKRGREPFYGPKVPLESRLPQQSLQRHNCIHILLPFLGRKKWTGIQTP